MYENTVQYSVVNLLREKHKTVSTAESCTAGLISKKITDISGSSEVFECGLVTYSARIKEKLANVNPETIRKYGVVSEETAREMAEGVREVSGSDYSVSITGVAGPGKDADGNESGTAWVAVSSEAETRAKLLKTDSDSRDFNRNEFARLALEFLLEEMQ